MPGAGKRHGRRSRRRVQVSPARPGLGAYRHSGSGHRNKPGPRSRLLSASPGAASSSGVRSHPFRASGGCWGTWPRTIEAARLLTHRAARLRDAGRPHTREAAMAKMRASDVAMETTINALQVHGGAGYRKDLPLERYVRDAKLTQIYEGTNQIQRIVIARQILE